MGYVARFRFARIAFRAAKWKPERKDRQAGKERRETDEMNSGVRVLTLNRPIEPGHKRRQRRQFRSAGMIRLNATGAFIRAANEHYKAAPMLNATDPGGWIARSVVNSRFTALTSAGDENVSPSNDGGRILSAALEAELIARQTSGLELCIAFRRIPPSAFNPNESRGP